MAAIVRLCGFQIAGNIDHRLRRRLCERGVVASVSGLVVLATCAAPVLRRIQTAVESSLRQLSANCERYRRLEAAEICLDRI